VAISYILNIKAFRTFFKVVVKPMVYADKWLCICWL